MHTNMKRRRIVSRITVSLLVLLLLIISACHGGGGGGAPAPVITLLTVGAPVLDTVALSGVNFYAASVTPGLLYKISITGLSDDADLLVFGADSTFTSLARCSIDNTSIAGTSAEDCVITASGNTLYFDVDGTFLSTSAGVYMIDIERIAVTNLNPSMPAPDSTTQMSAGVYSVTVTPGVAYTISITGLDDDADLYVFGNDNTFTSGATCFPDNTLFAGTTPEDCTLTSSAGTLNFIVDGIFSTKTTVDYTVLVAPAPAIPNPSSEGTPSAPVVLSSETPTTGQVGFNGVSYYDATGLAPGRYTVSITGLTADVDLTVYSDNTFTNPVSCLIDNIHFLGLTSEDCTLQVSGTQLYFTVKAETLSDGAAFILLVEPGP